MHQNAAPDHITLKTRELCQAILDDASFRDIKEGIEAFIANESARERYDAVSRTSSDIQQRHAQGEAISDGDFAKFEADRASLLQDPIARGFIDARREMQRIQESVMQYLAKTFELGRMPTLEDLEEGGCCGGKENCDGEGGCCQDEDHEHEAEHSHSHGGCGCGHSH